jgi:hypothetical protein
LKIHYLLLWEYQSVTYFGSLCTQSSLWCPSTFRILNFPSTLKPNRRSIRLYNRPGHGWIKHIVPDIPTIMFLLRVVYRLWFEISYTIDLCVFMCLCGITVLSESSLYLLIKITTYRIQVLFLINIPWCISEVKFSTSIKV